MRALLQYIDAFTEHSGRLLAWLALFMALVTALVVFLRYGFNIGSIAAQEAVTYMHAAFTSKVGIGVCQGWLILCLLARCWLDFGTED